MTWDFFVSHASEDKDDIARPLANELAEAGYRVWFDEFELHVGSRLRAKIDEGLSKSHFGVVILSPSFFEKKWPKSELDALFSQEDYDRPRLLPVWHELEAQDVAKHSPLIAARLAVLSRVGIPNVRAAILKAAHASGMSVPHERLVELLDKGDLSGVRALLEANPSVVIGKVQAGYHDVLFTRPQVRRWDGRSPDFVLATKQPTPNVYELRLILLGPLAGGSKSEVAHVMEESNRMLAHARREASEVLGPRRYTPRASATIYIGRRRDVAVTQVQESDPLVAIRSYDSLLEGWQDGAARRCKYIGAGHATSFRRMMANGE